VRRLPWSGDDVRRERQQIDRRPTRRGLQAVTTLEQARHAARGPAVEKAARAGLVAKGLLYALVGTLAARVALGYGGEPEDRGGALRTVADDPLGKALVVGVAVGLAAYAVWRFAQAVFDREHEGDGVKALAKRASYFVRGAWYVGLCGLAVSVLVGRGESSASSEKEATAGVLEQPLGRWAVLAVGAGLVCAGVYNAYRAFSGKYRKDMKLRKMTATENRVFNVVGVAGHVARGTVFALIGIFVARAAWQFDPTEAIGLDGALQKLAHQSHGRLWLGAAASGLGAYGLYCFVQARYRDV
jgi:hypothetical protein